MSARTSHCVMATPGQWEEITARARKAGWPNRSRFVVACALKKQVRPTCRLVLTTQEQRVLLRRFRLLSEICLDLYEPLPGIGMTTLEGIAFLCLVAEEERSRRATPPAAPDAVPRPEQPQPTDPPPPAPPPAPQRPRPRPSPEDQGSLFGEDAS